MFVQPRAQNPTGVAMSRARRDELATLIADSDMLVVEDDHSGSIASADLHSFGELLPDRVAHIRSYSKSHGPDLRLAALGGPAHIVDPVIHRRRLGPSWTSRLLQQVLIELLTDRTAQDKVASAASAYRERRQTFVDHLTLHGLPVDAHCSGSGMNLWVPVVDEQRAVTALAARGIAVAPGTPFTVTNADLEHIRVTTAVLSTPADIEHAANAVAAAAVKTERSSKYRPLTDLKYHL